VVVLHLPFFNLNLPEAVLNGLEILSLITGVGYAVLAARRNRLCWITGAVSSACAAVAYGARGLPMQSGLQVFFVGMALYGWLSWTRSAATGELPVGVWPLPFHLVAALLVMLVSFGSASLLIANTDAAAWPRLDSLTTWFSLLATWLAARGRLENWLYWIVIDVVLVFLSYKQGSMPMALLNFLFIAIAVGGFIAWRRRFQAQAPAVAA
jgi:nicotinamide mononucleotide transporter